MSNAQGTPRGQESVMSQRDEFRQYAEEAMLSASQSTNAPEVKALKDLAHVWALAAFESERVVAKQSKWR
jgi:hypothetical protein